MNPQIIVEYNTHCAVPKCGGTMEKANIPTKVPSLVQISYKCNLCDHRTSNPKFNVIDANTGLFTLPSIKVKSDIK